MNEGLLRRLGVLVAALAVSTAAPAHAQEKAEAPVNWTRGPATADVGKDVGEIALGDSLALAGEEDTQRLLREMGNPTHGSEVGLVVPTVDGESWFVILEWQGIGFVKDDERNTIDADALLKNIQRATEAANKERKKTGASALHVVGWAEAPHYDQASHNLTWAIRGKTDDGEEVVNYNVRLLGREGVMSVTYVDDPAGIANAKPKVDAVIQGFSFKRGKTYAEWVPGDKVAAYGLTALVAAGAGAAAVKTGLLAALGGFIAKAWKAVAVALVALGAGIARTVKSLFARKPRSGGAPSDG
ncbi:DUF2167 domain-containing protein [Anaeromyxobacter sp. PSR-1]|uniref:DUF2167 domain-containing protein n=1 Tax=unclassified Anaeromyxobacter TaxID=2620896 RepID=UPI0005DF67E9|nr:DUF2167 domain-containing protein [Anaeromyxobacter sp. PSR-1]GAO02429.1 hypothetical protein PSR1_01301 [Anaeromyxobacter sp. PSR-1]